jgi:hypothetical protein
MKRLIAFSLVCAVGCGGPKPTAAPVEAAPVGYEGIWRAGSSGDDYQIVRLFPNKTASFFGTKQEVIGPDEVKGDEMIVDAGQATMKSPGFISLPEYTNDRYPFHLKRLSDTKIEITDLTGLFFGVKTPVAFDRLTKDELVTTSILIMARKKRG